MNAERAVPYLRTTADDHTLSVDNPILGRDVDQFLFVVRKPR